MRKRPGRQELTEVPQLPTAPVGGSFSFRDINLHANRCRGCLGWSSLWSICVPAEGKGGKTGHIRFRNPGAEQLGIGGLFSKCSRERRHTSKGDCPWLGTWWMEVNTHMVAPVIDLTDHRWLTNSASSVKWSAYDKIKGVTVGYSAKAVANYFLATYSGHGITLLKLQKLVYLAHGWNFVFRPNDPLIDDERAEAWTYGPVFPSLYTEFSHRGSQPISELATEVKLGSLEPANVETYVPQIPKSDGVIRHLLDEIWRIYGGFSGVQLSEMCHRMGSPWHMTRSKFPRLRNAHISNELIQSHYKQLYREHSTSV